MEKNLSSEQLQSSPELAILFTLDAALHATIRALHAVHPYLEEDEPHSNIPEILASSVSAAEVIVHLSGTMLDAIDRYRRVTHDFIHFGSTSCSDGPPF